jgi:UDP-glucose 4-epimerase
MGYVGPAVVRRLRATYPDAAIIGFDTGYFAHCMTGAPALPERRLSAQHFGDIRTIDPDLLVGCDAVVHLAAISNDPIGQRFEGITCEINQDSSVSLARAAAAVGVGNFVFASSCSVYGLADGPARREDDPLNPLTAYARSKIGAENALRELDCDMTITCLRFATACGMSERLRLDLVLNDFVAGALTSGRISVLSDGTPWRPLIDVADMAVAIEWAVSRSPECGGRFLTVNAGTETANYQVRELAERVMAALPGTEVSINHNAPADSRSYRVDFSLYGRLAPDHQPRVTLDESIARLIDGLRVMGFADREYRDSSLMRLRVIEDHVASGRLTEDLKWTAVAERALQ